MILRPYQTDQLNAIVSAFKAGQNRQLVKSPTGTGKTVMFAHLLKHGPIERWLAKFEAGKRRMLVLAHREELLEQSAAKIQEANPGLYVAIEQADRVAAYSSDVVVASIQTLAARHFARLKRLLQTGPFRIVVVDEAHHTAADTYRTALVHLGFLPEAEASDVDNIEAPDYDDVDAMKAALAGWDEVAPKDRLLVGVTATPNRTDAIGLGCVFQTISYSYDLRNAIADGWLAKIVPWVIESDTSLDGVKTTHGDFNQKQLADTVNTAERNDRAVAGWLEHAPARQTLAFTVDVKHAHDLAETFTKKGIVASAVSGETPREERRQILQAYRDKRIQLITNCMVLTEGTDLPETGCILNAKPTKSSTLFAQLVGRGLRLWPGKDDCILLDVVDVARKHSLQTAGVLYGLPPGLDAQGMELEALKRLVDEMVANVPGMTIGTEKRLTLAELRARATSFDIWSIRPMETYGEGLAMEWLRVGDEAFQLEYPWGSPGATEVLRVGKNLLGQFELSVHERIYDAATRHGWNTDERIIGLALPTAAAALQYAETYVKQERSTVVRLKGKEAGWKANVASEKQLALLRRLKIPFPPGITMGKASQLIDLANARRGPR